MQNDLGPLTPGQGADVWDLHTWLVHTQRKLLLEGKAEDHATVDRWRRALLESIKRSCELESPPIRLHVAGTPTMITPPTLREET